MTFLEAISQLGSPMLSSEIKLRLNEEHFELMERAAQSLVESKDKEISKLKECALGVGDGTGQHFVYGEYETIKLLQTKILAWESKDKEIARLTALNESADKVIEILHLMPLKEAPFEVHKEWGVKYSDIIEAYNLLKNKK